MTDATSTLGETLDGHERSRAASIDAADRTHGAARADLEAERADALPGIDDEGDRAAVWVPV